METLLSIPPSYSPHKLKTLPLRDQPAYRVTANAAACSLAELLAAVVGGAQQIEVAEGILARFGGDVQRIYKAHVAELARSMASASRLRYVSRLPWRWGSTSRAGWRTAGGELAVGCCRPGPLRDEPAGTGIYEGHATGYTQSRSGGGRGLPRQRKLFTNANGELFKPAMQRMAPAIICITTHHRILRPPRTM